LLHREADLLVFELFPVVDLALLAVHREGGIHTVVKKNAQGERQLAACSRKDLYLQ
jgi:hypothetical protein